LPATQTATTAASSMMAWATTSGAGTTGVSDETCAKNVCHCAWARAACALNQAPHAPIPSIVWRPAASRAAVGTSPRAKALAMGIEHKQLGEALVATVRANPQNRDELRAILDELRQHIPEESIAGPPFCVFQFVTSIKDGFDVEVGFPVSQPVEAGEIRTRAFPALEVLSLTHKGPPAELGETYRTLYGRAAAHGLISDEFAREVYPADDEVEVQFVLHDWNGLLARNLDRVLGKETRCRVMHGVDALTIDSTVDERFQWLKGVMERLDEWAGEDARYDAVSSCAHVFPRGQIAKLTTVYQETRAATGDPWQAVDAVIEFMVADPSWADEPARREGHVIYSSKSPRDPQGHASATDEMERRTAYCFCPLI